MGRYAARFAAGPQDVQRAQALRAARFRGADAGGGIDGDSFDAVATHVLVEETATGRLVCCFRLMRFETGAEIADSYSAQFYGLAGLARHPGPLLELGRFCIAEDARDPAVLRVAWGALAAHVEAEGIALLFGCSSFAGTDAGAYAETFALLRERHLGPRRWLPRIKSPAVFRFARGVRLGDLKAALKAMPPLLRTYLAMGGWVSDHAVVDRDLGTLHVFTGLEVGRISTARRRALGLS